MQSNQIRATGGNEKTAKRQGPFSVLCYACLVPILKGDLESAFAVLGVNVNYRIFKAGRTAILQKKYHDPLNNAEA